MDVYRLRSSGVVPGRLGCAARYPFSPKLEAQVKPSRPERTPLRCFLLAALVAAVVSVLRFPGAKAGDTPASVQSTTKDERPSSISRDCRDLLDQAEKLAMFMQHAQIAIPHFLTVAFEQQGEITLGKCFEKCGGDLYKVKKAMSDILIKMPTSTDFLAYDEVTSSPQLNKAALRALAMAQRDGKMTIGVEHLVLALAENVSTRRMLEQAGCDVKVFLEEVVTVYEAKLKADMERRSEKKSEPAKGASTQRAAQSEEEIIRSFCTDMTELAEKGKFEPVLGRNKEIKEVATVLTRRGKGNPCLIGEPGVGKTAVVEGLAQRIIEGLVPKALRNKTLFAVDLGGLLAGASYRGEFEKRMKALIDFAVKSSGKVILFIDEIHMIMGAGKSDSSMDAANLLKPPMARGELRLVGATTLDEYKIIEKDAAMERRLKPILIEEPSTDRAIFILKKLAPMFESHHQMKITEEAIIAAVMLSHKYVKHRKLPDKAIDLLDEAAATKRVKWDMQNQEDDEMEEQAAEDKANAEEHEATEREDAERIKKQKHGKGTEETLQQLESEIEAEAKKDDEELVLGADDVAAVISAWTGIPLGKLSDDEKSKILKLADVLHARVIGQDDAVRAVADAMIRARAGLNRDDMPLGSFLFLGPTGVGKTELARGLAMEMFHSEQNLIRIDMSEFSEQHTVSRLIGSPPGYVGHESGGQLTEAVRRRPHSVVLFDEIEKGHPQVLQIMLQMLDGGRLTDGKGVLVDFTSCVVILTSNVGAQYIISAFEQSEKDGKGALARFDETSGSLEHFAEAAKGAEAADKEEEEKGDGDKKKSKTLSKSKASRSWKKEARRKVLSEIAGAGLLKPEVVNRFSGVIIFEPMKAADVKQIVRLQSRDLERALAKKGIEIILDQSAEDFIAQRAYTHKFGARPIKRFIDNNVGAKMAPWILTGYLQSGMRVTVVASKRHKNTLEAHVSDICRLVMGKCDRTTRKARVLASIPMKDENSPDDPGR
ncbi:aaa family protein [Cystoisospora suis]|uniref:Aaa family protein n=1 Tax=Cystoisospora suis TaxID=483139 RepID=A0A2C6L2U1_9APIC|nr:aaa family protein [Cystoisospora suis]